METLGPFKGIYYRVVLGCRDLPRKERIMSKISLWCIGVYMGIMEKKMETLGPFKGIHRVVLGYT